MKDCCIVKYLPDHPVYTRQSVDQAYCELFGVTPDRVIGRSCLESTPVAERAKVIQKISRCIKQDAAIPSTENSLKADGSLFLMRWIDIPITDADDSVVEMIAVGTSITMPR